MLKLERALQKVGGLKLVVEFDRNWEWATCELEGFGKFEARLSWFSKRPGLVSLNHVEVSEYSKAYKPLADFLRQRGLALKKNAPIVFGITDAEKQLISEHVKAIHERFLSDLYNGKVKVKTIRVIRHEYVEYIVPSAECEPGCDYSPFTVADMLSYYLDDTAHAWRKWNKRAEGEDITTEVIEVIKRALEPPNNDEACGDHDVVCWECGRRFTYEQARRMVKAGEAEWSGPTGFYCGC